MIIQPRTRGFICLTSHPEGCAAHVKQQIAYVQSKGKITNGPKKVLVIGASTGFGLASRIATAFGSDAATIGVFFEKSATEGRPATAGWYNSAAFEQEAAKAGLYANEIVRRNEAGYLWRVFFCFFVKVLLLFCFFVKMKNCYC